MAQRSLRDSPRSQPDLNGTEHTVHPVLDDLDRASRPIAPNPSDHSAFRNRRTRQHQLRLIHRANISVGQLNGVGGLCFPFIRREKGSARDDFQGENREPMLHDHRDVGGRVMPGAIAEDVPSARSRLGGFLN